MGQCVLVFGVSGVGKTHACADYAARHPDTLFVSASSLLKAATAASGEALRTASAAQIRRNQARLAGALAAFRAGREALPVLIDAHGVIDNDSAFVRIPLSAIRSLSPDRLILLEAAPAMIAERRAADARSRPQRPIEAIVREIAAERAAVKSYARALDLNLAIGEVGPGFRLDALMEAAG
jgi:adenylate kinase